MPGAYYAVFACGVTGQRSTLCNKYAVVLSCESTWLSVQCLEEWVVPLLGEVIVVCCMTIIPTGGHQLTAPCVSYP